MIFTMNLLVYIFRILEFVLNSLLIIKLRLSFRLLNKVYVTNWLLHKKNTLALTKDFWFPILLELVWE
jgi:hypothetical protein